ncbi:hypothetical protein [Lactococcus lactis]|uniref:TIGR04197 family type VII secretion effector n=1 Tax=Lactococcus lactis TaxID=1358 RepID=A0AAW8UKB9_9LACT|nr:hypothetical protein [Lactococcus lactis]MDT2882060.1 hypothetical protein [Lactococcus lactis]MDT2946781.1 hypothetical protein [Lactococcus lactis]MDT2947601.1 hypothetical protein [Lactococcus lactis]
MAGKISSDLGSANAAVSQFKTGNSSSQHFSLGESNITGMKSAEKISNSIIGDLSKLESGIKKQADKFPKLAAVIESRDKQDAADLTTMNWGF